MGISKDLVGLRASVGFGTIIEKIVAIDQSYAIDYEFTGGIAASVMRGQKGRVEFLRIGDTETRMTWSIESVPLPRLSFLSGSILDVTIPVFVQRLQDKCNSY